MAHPFLSEHGVRAFQLEGEKVSMVREVGKLSKDGQMATGGP